MSKEQQTASDTRGALPREVIAKMLGNNFDKLPDTEKKLIAYSPAYLGFNGALAGLVSNSLFRRCLNVRQALFSSALPMAAIPFLTTFTLYHGVLSYPLLHGELNCPSCVVIRGALVGVVSAGLYPIALAIPINLGLATLYSTTPVPETGAKMRFIMDVSRPVFRKMRAVLVLQAFFGAYLGSRNFDTYLQLAKITFGPDEEELRA